MSHFTDAQSLIADQYRDASNLSARIELHERFSTNRYGWHCWVFDHLALEPGERVLELGCGSGTLWSRNRERIPPLCRITLTDLSPGMIAAAQRNLAQEPQIAEDRPGAPFSFKVLDAQAISFDAGSFDLVVANHMLYHVPEMDLALAGIHRILKPGGRLIATTVGRAHLGEITELVRSFAPGTPYDTGSPAVRFGLENGQAVLARYFNHVALHIYRDALVVTEAAPLVAYVLSMMPDGAQLTGQKAEAFGRFVEQVIAERGAIRVEKAQGLFEATA